MRRRKFLKNTFYASSIGLIPSCKSKTLESDSVEKEIKQNKSPLGVALVGLGSYSAGQLAPALSQTKHCKLTGIVTGSPEKIPEWQKKYGIKDSNVYNYENMDEIANNDEIDVIYIVLPTGLHAEYAIRAANCGKHVWCEKPMAMTAKECQTVIDACNKNNVRLAIGYRMMHETNTKELISYVDSKPFGAITNIQATACYAGGRPNSWRAIKSMGGGAMYDMGVYTVNGIRYASGMEPVEVLSADHIISRPALFTEVDETTTYKLRLQNGLIAEGLTSVGMPENELKVICEQGWYNLSPMQAYYNVTGRRSDGHRLDANVPCQQCIQMDDDALAILNNTPFICPGEMGKRDIQIIEGIFESARTRQSVDVSV